MKVAYFTKYEEKAASSRMRSFQYFPFLEKSGIFVSVFPFFDAIYLNHLYAGSRSIWCVFKSYIDRFWSLRKVKDFDVIIIEKELFPYFPAWFEILFSKLGISYIVDYDDAIFHNYDQNRNPVVKYILGNKIAYVMKNSSLVIAGNQYLANYAKKSGAKKIEILPTVIDLDRYSIKGKQKTEQFVIGWIGTVSTFEKHLLPQVEWIHRYLDENPDVEFRVIGISTPDARLRATYIPWTKETEVSEIKKIDVGIMPLIDSTWERGKCAYKLIQYAACGIPGVASKVGMNEEVILDGETGFLVSSDNEWKEHLDFLKNNLEQRYQFGNKARVLVEHQFCIQVTSEKLVNIIKKGIQY